MKFDVFKCYFTADDGAGAGGAADGASQQSGSSAAQQNDDKKFSQNDLNGIVAKETAKIQEKLLKELGITDVKSAKEGLAELKKIQDAQKDETQRLADQNKELETKATDSTKKADFLEAKWVAVEKGIPADKCERAVKLALNGDYPGETMAEKIDAVIKDFPEFAQSSAGQQTGQNFGSQSQGMQTSEIDKLDAIIKANMK